MPGPDSLSRPAQLRPSPTGRGKGRSVRQDVRRSATKAAVTTRESASRAREASGSDFVRALAKGLAVIEAFDTRSPSMTLSDVAKKTGLSRGTARRLLLTLVDLGYAGFDGKRFGPWMAATCIVPRSFDDVLRERPATVQDRWFARLYGLKPLMIAGLAVFWCVSGLIALTVAYPAAVAIMTSHGFSDGLARPFTIVSSLMDISVGLAIAVRRSCAVGLIAGVVVSLGYMAGAALLTPDLWIEPLGALVKTGPAIVLMLVALATLDDR